MENDTAAERSPALSRFVAKSFQGISGLELPLKQANIPTGAHDVGKTAMLEAIRLFAGRRNPQLLWDPGLHRYGDAPVDRIIRLSDSGGVELSAVGRGVGRSVRAEFHSCSGAPLRIGDSER